MRRFIDDDVHEETRWVVSYADFITLLFAFFVIMYSISSVNEGQYKVLSEQFEQAFYGVLASTGYDQYGQGSLNSSQLEAQLHHGLPDWMQESQLSIHASSDWLEIDIPSRLLFDVGQATLTLEAQEVLNAVADILVQFQNAIRVEGFTDNQPIANSQYSSNWELSVARATTVVRQLVANGIQPERLAAVGYGEYQPIGDNLTSSGRQKNRRVVLMISKGALLRPDGLD